jgi:hypothetical protein
METAKLLLDILKQNEPQTSEYFKNVLVGQKTVIKFGSIDNEEISLNFLIKGEIDKNIDDLERKVNALFNTDTELSIINEILSNIKTPVQINFAPYLKISKDDEPLQHAFMINIKY